ncbi:hypothetical protein [Mycobacterium colombiense]|uniref:hypothetical protein n=1 Tax=Mycobacterium colombiense TaxID=339268 RepID=UPI0007ECEA1C|nr:hypothetical protein [Mycobacterium colombiense]OBJ26871.1 hypothetical protein A5620_05470 [Mycobacterium colombiense]
MTRQMPETLRQAQRWDAIKLRYTGAGICDRCAAQAAWGHQDNAGGWNNLRPPCARCKTVVKGFPIPTTNPQWRKFERPQDYKRNGTVPTALGNAVEETHGLLSQQAVSL